MKTQTYINDYNCITPLGFDVKSNWQNLISGNSGIKKQKIIASQPEFCTAVIDNEELEKVFSENCQDQNFTRLEKMLLLSLKPIVERNPVSEKSVLILSTTKGNVSTLKNQNQPPAAAFLASSAQKIGDFFGFKTKPVVVSNACVSGVMAVSLAKNLLESGQFEDAFVMAGDEVSEFIVSGFNSFQALSANPCKPYDENRDGISIGEAAAAVYVSKKMFTEKFSFKILGESAVNDANHISGPSRTGEGLFRSIQNALKEADLQPEKIDFLSAHGTATNYNDEMESIAFTRADLQNAPVNSLKGFYGHTLGAAGLLETVIAMESAKENMLIATKNFQKPGVSQPINVIRDNQQKEISIILKTASGFGGCNAAVILEKVMP